MPRTHGVGKLFAHRMEYPTRHFPAVDVGTTQEIEHPFRQGSSVVIRLPFSRKAVAVGWWGRSVPEDQALYGALGARPRPDIDLATLREDGA